MNEEMFNEFLQSVQEMGEIVKGEEKDSRCFDYPGSEVEKIRDLVEEEKIVALYLAEVLGDTLAKKILQDGEVKSKEEATHLGRFFWAMVNRSAEGAIELPCEGSLQYWTEKLYNSIGGYLERAGYQEQWNEEIDRA